MKKSRENKGIVAKNSSSINNEMKTKGITLIALVITVIVLLILAGVGVATLTGDNGILTRAGNAKEQTEISEEKEIISLSVTGAKTKENYSNIQKSELQKQLDINAGEGKTQLYDDGDRWVVYFLVSGRVYGVKNDNIQEENIGILTKDSEPGKFDGSGTEDDPYIIMSIEDLMYLSQTAKDETNYADKYLKMGRTLNFKSELSYYNYETREYNEFLEITDDVGLMYALTSEQYQGFIPIGKFAGTFDGQGYEIKNIYINSTKDRVGFFSYISNATIRNLRIRGDIKQFGTGEYYCGGIVGCGSSTSVIENCINSATIESVNYATGGIAGNFSGKISGCINEGNITTKRIAGGINGIGNVTVLNCYNLGNIIGTGSGSAAGIAGGDASVSSKIYNCYNAGNIKCTAYSIWACSGGIFGYMSNWMTSLDIINCYNVGETTSLWSTGSIIAIIRGIAPTTKNCYYLETLSKQTSIATPYSKEYMQRQDFVDELNNYIESNDDDIDTSGWAKWVIQANGYPTLDFNTIWDGKEWIHRE